MRYWVLGAAAFLLALPASAAPGDMDAQTFLTTAEELKKKGPLALMSSDLKVLKREAEGAANAYRARIRSDREAGRTPHSCPPASKQSMDSDQLLGHLRSYPAARRSSITMKTAFADLMKKRYPCG